MIRMLYDLSHTFLISVTSIQQDHAFELSKISSHVGKPPGGGYMTCGWTGACRPVFRKVPSSNYRNFPSYPFLS